MRKRGTSEQLLREARWRETRMKAKRAMRYPWAHCVLALLAEEPTVYSDGGGKVKAVGRPIRGPDFVSRFIAGIWPRFMAPMERQYVNINGSPGLIMRSQGQVHYAFSFEIANDRVRNIYIISNPDKLRHVVANG